LAGIYRFRIAKAIVAARARFWQLSGRMAGLTDEPTVVDENRAFAEIIGITPRYQIKNEHRALVHSGL